jgi:hypothetical protein
MKSMVTMFWRTGVVLERAAVVLVTTIPPCPTIYPGFATN